MTGITARSWWSMAGSASSAASISRAPTRTLRRPACPPTATRSTPIGAIPPWKSAVPRSPNSSDCSSAHGRNRTAIRCRQPTTSRPSRVRAYRPFASSAAHRAIRGRSITSPSKRAIRAAEKRIWLSSGYFVPPHQEREDLAKAARRGVDLRLVLPSHTDVEDAVYRRASSLRRPAGSRRTHL